MWKKSDDLSDLLSSPEAQALAGLLQGMDTEALRKAAALATSGDAAGAKALLMQDPRLRELMNHMEERDGGI